MRMLRSASFSVLALVALAGCPTNPITDASPDVTDETADVTNDVPPADTGPDPRAPLTYMPEGCSYTVTTTTGTMYNQMGVDTTFGAMPDPRNVHVMWPSNPSTAAAFLWETDRATLATVVEYGTSATTLDHTQRGHVTTAGTGLNAVTEHEVHLCGLQPNTTYYYHVGGPGHFSATHHFKTAPAAGDATADVNFVITGDSRGGGPAPFPTDWRNIQMQISTVTGANTPDFQIFTGDAILLGTDQPSWEQWFGAATDSMGSMPWVMLNGNHEALTTNFLVQIAQPQQNNELYFSFDYGPIHFVVLNDSLPPADLDAAITGTYATWLEADLAAVNRAVTPWVIVTHHKGPYTTSARHATDTDVVLIRNTWPPIFDRHHVDLVLNGHSHDLEVTHPLVAGAVAPTGTQGTVYMLSGGSGAGPLDPVTPGPLYQHAESILCFALAHATPTTLTLTPYRVDGTVITEGIVNLTH